MKIKYSSTLLFLLLIVAVSCSRKINQHWFTATEAVTIEPEANKVSGCGLSINYAPSEEYPEHTPMRYINVRVHQIRSSENDPYTFDSMALHAFVIDLLAQANARLEENFKMALPPGNATPALPIRYRYQLFPDPTDPNDTGIKIHIDSTLAYFNYKDPKHSHYNGDAYKKYGDLKGQALNFIMVEHHPDSIKSKTYKAKSEGVGFPEWLKLIGSYQFYDTIYTDAGKMVTTPNVRLLNHEVGHTLGLPHTWAGNDGCDDTPNHPNCWDWQSEKCPDGIYSNNMMDYNNISRAITPCQLGKIHYNFSKLGSSQRKLLDPRWCTYNPSASITIGPLEKVVWDCAKDLEGDLVVAGELTIQCRVSFPKGGRLIVKPRGRLILDGATLTNLCEEQWEGITIQSIKKKKGTVVYLASPNVFNVRNPVQ